MKDSTVLIKKLMNHPECLSDFPFCVEIKSPARHLELIFGGEVLPLNPDRNSYSSLKYIILSINDQVWLQLVFQFFQHPETCARIKFKGSILPSTSETFSLQTVKLDHQLSFVWVQFRFQRSAKL